MTVLVMNLRQQKGVALAKGRMIRRQGNLWLVPSQTGDGTLYAVDLANQKCTCLDFKESQEKCKHIFAAEFASARQHNAVIPMIPQTAMATRPTYPQQQPAYNAAQVNEKDTFQQVLHELCDCLPTALPARGRPPYPLRDGVFSITYKVYSTLSARRFSSDLREAHERRLIARVPHFNTILNILGDDGISDTLRNLVERSALPLNEHETHFAADSTKFSPSRKAHWADSKTGKEGLQQDWVKCHMMVGVDSHIVTAIEIREQNASDAKTFKALFDTTSKNFDIVAISADKGYCSQENYDIIGRNGATPYIAFLSHVKATTGNKHWKESFNRFKSNPQEYKDGYHQRSNAEAAFSAMKRIFGNSLRTRKSEVAMKNEILCKILCHNLVVLIHEMYKGHIRRPFWGEKEQYEN